jgi:hypothetical protein
MMSIDVSDVAETIVIIVRKTILTISTATSAMAALDASAQRQG